MSFKHSIGIYGIGRGLPETVRTNDHWSEETIARWERKEDSKLDQEKHYAVNETYPGTDIVLEMMAKYRNDPFKGAKYRRVLADGERTSKFEILAVEEAINKSGIDPKDIGLFLSQSSLPDYLCSPNATLIHDKLGLNHDCTTLQTDGMCAAFLTQYSLAAAWLQQNPGKYALLVQSAGTTRLADPETRSSAWFGDGASATILGKVRDGFGLCAETFRTRGELAGSVVVGHPEREWYEGAPHAFIPNPRNSRIMLVSVAHLAETVAVEALKRAEWDANDVDFYACHQGFAWLREATQRHLKLDQAKYTDTFEDYGSVIGANIPFVLYKAQEERLLNEGDKVLSFAGATGLQLASLCFRWGGKLN